MWSYWVVVGAIPIDGQNTCCPMVRCDSIRAVYHRMRIEDSQAFVHILDIPHSRINDRICPLNSPPQLLTERGFAAEARHFFIGKELDPPIRDTHLPFNVTSLPKKPTVSKPCDQMTVSVPSTHQPPYLPELDHAMRKWFGA